MPHCSQLKEQLPSFDLGFMENEQFREFYKFTFQFSREGTHRTIEKDVAVPLLQTVSMTTRTDARGPYADAIA